MKTTELSDLIPLGETGAYTLPGRPLPGATVDFSSDAALRQHGLLLRPPCPTAPPRVLRLWREISRRQWRVVPDPIHGGSSQTSVKRRHRTIIPLERNQNGSYTNWCGSIVGAQIGYAISSAWISFSAPNPALPAAGIPESLFDGYVASIWVGLDGQSVTPGPGGSTQAVPGTWLPGGDIWQAGLDFSIDANSNVSYGFWWEWLSPSDPGPQSVALPVSAGDNILIQIAYVTAAGTITHATATFANQTQGQTTPTLIQPVPAVTLPDGSTAPIAFPNGSSAEWIVETPFQTKGPDPNTGLIQRNFSALPSFEDILIGGGYGTPEGNVIKVGLPGIGDLVNLDGFPAAGNSLTVVADGDNINVSYNN